VLQVDEHRLAIGRHRHTRDLTTSHTGEDALHLFGLGVSNEHLIVVAPGLCAVGLDEDTAIRVTPDAVWRTVHLATLVECLLRDEEQVPLERATEVAVGVLPANDVTRRVLTNWVGGVHAGLAGATKMDRPEWISTGADGWQYGTLTNNSNRGHTGQPGVNSGRLDRQQRHNRHEHRVRCEITELSAKRLFLCKTFWTLAAYLLGLLSLYTGDFGFLLRWTTYCHSTKR